MHAGDRRPLRPSHVRLAGAVVALALVAAACSSGGGDRAEPAPGQEPQAGLAAAVANYDIAAGEDTRFMVGLFTEDGFVSGGQVDLAFSFLGTQESPLAEPDPGPKAVATFLPIPGFEEEAAHPPEAEAHEHARGVYAAVVAFDRPGFWQVDVTAQVDGAPASALAAFEVFPEHRVPAPGDRALPTDNLTIDSKGAAPGAIDSRAATTGEVPDPELHEWTIARAIAEGRPALVVFSTPVFCISRFCGPITEMVAGLAEDYSDRAVFIHVEIWRDFQERRVNKAAADWLLRGGDLQEPWVFLIGSDGTIAARWDNVATRPEIEPLLRELPPMAG